MLGYLRDRRRRRKYGPSIVVVSGLPRSGTSMMMNMLDAAGLELVSDRVRGADDDNPKGYFEDERVKKLDRDGDRSWLAGCRGKVIKVISYLLKDLPDEHHYQVIFMHRDLGEVIASQNKMLTRRGEATHGSEEEAARMYRTHLGKVRVILEDRSNIDFLEVDYADVVAHPTEQARRVSKFLGRPLDPDRMARAVDPSLYRNRREARETTAR